MQVGLSGFVQGGSGKGTTDVTLRALKRFDGCDRRIFVITLRKLIMDTCCGVGVIKALKDASILCPVYHHGPFRLPIQE